MTRPALYLLLLAAACASPPRQQQPSPAAPPPAAPAPVRSTAAGAESPRAAVEAFMTSIREQNIQETSVRWGTEKGPASGAMPRQELEKRILTMQCFLAHDRFRIVNDAPGLTGRRIFRVELTRGSLSRQTNVGVVQGPGGRWFVESAELEPVKDLCRAGG